MQQLSESLTKRHILGLTQSDPLVETFLLQERFPRWRKPQVLVDAFNQFTDENMWYPLTFQPLNKAFQSVAFSQNKKNSYHFKCGDINAQEDDMIHEVRLHRFEIANALIAVFHAITVTICK